MVQNILNNTNVSETIRLNF